MVWLSTTFQSPSTAGLTVGSWSPIAAESGEENVIVMARAGVIVWFGAGWTVAFRPRPSGNQVTRIGADSFCQAREAACTCARPKLVRPICHGSETTLRGTFRVRHTRVLPRLTTTTRTGVEKCTCTGWPGRTPSHCCGREVGFGTT